MPYKCEPLHIPKPKDRRVKLTDEQRIEIKASMGLYSQRKLAAMYNVSRRLITYILDPKKQEANLKQRAERGGSKIYYDKDKHTIAMRTHRQYKQQLYLNGELKQENLK